MDIYDPDLSKNANNMNAKSMVGRVFGGCALTFLTSGVYFHLCGSLRILPDTSCGCIPVGLFPLLPCQKGFMFIAKMASRGMDNENPGIGRSVRQTFLIFFDLLAAVWSPGHFGKDAIFEVPRKK